MRLEGVRTRDGTRLGAWGALGKEAQRGCGRGRGLVSYLYVGGAALEKGSFLHFALAVLLPAPSYFALFSSCESLLAVLNVQVLARDAGSGCGCAGWVADGWRAGTCGLGLGT